MSGFKVDMEYQGYVFLGGAQGTFEARDGRRVPFFNMFVLSPASTYTSEDYRAFGLKAEKKKCLSVAFPALFQLLASDADANVSRIDIACDDREGYLDMDARDPIKIRVNDKL